MPKTIQLTIEELGAITQVVLDAPTQDYPTELLLISAGQKILTALTEGE